MPRGYLKHSKEAGRKRARGSRSHRVRVWSWLAKIEKGQKCVFPPYIGEQSRIAQDLAFGRYDFSLAKADPPANEGPRYPVGDCLVCMETSPLIRLSENCRWHGAACQGCLRKYHVTNAHKSTHKFEKATSCFHPQCDQSVSHAQLQKHGIIRSEDETKKPDELLLFCKANKMKEPRVVYCPGCEFPRVYPNKLSGSDKTQHCKSCQEAFLVSPDYTTIRALERLGNDKIGKNDGWARSPGCSVLVSKGNGCSHIHCGLCHCHFDWWKAARPHDSDVHLW